jgi:hypothetical protein
MSNLPTRQCPECEKTFTAIKPNHTYCSATCRAQGKVRRKKERIHHALRRAAFFFSQNLADEANRGRKSAGRPLLLFNDWLAARAEVVEAEEQIKKWQDRLSNRQERLRRLNPPDLERTLICVEDLVLKIPARAQNATHLGIASTDGTFAVLLFGTPKRNTQPEGGKSDE